MTTVSELEVKVVVDASDLDRLKSDIVDLGASVSDAVNNVRISDNLNSELGQTVAQINQASQATQQFGRQMEVVGTSSNKAWTQAASGARAFSVGIKGITAVASNVVLGLSMIPGVMDDATKSALGTGVVIANIGVGAMGALRSITMLHKGITNLSASAGDFGTKILGSFSAIGPEGMIAAAAITVVAVAMGAVILKGDNLAMAFRGMKVEAEDLGKSLQDIFQGAATEIDRGVPGLGNWLTTIEKIKTASGTIEVPNWEHLLPPVYMLDSFIQQLANVGRTAKVTAQEIEDAQKKDLESMQADIKTTLGLTNEEYARLLPTIQANEAAVRAFAAAHSALDASIAKVKELQSAYDGLKSGISTYEDLSSSQKTLGIDVVQTQDAATTAYKDYQKLLKAATPEMRQYLQTLIDAGKNNLDLTDKQKAVYTGMTAAQKKQFDALAAAYKATEEATNKASDTAFQFKTVSEDTAVAWKKLVDIAADLKIPAPTNLEGFKKLAETVGVQLATAITVMDGWKAKFDQIKDYMKQGITVPITAQWIGFDQMPSIKVPEALTSKDISKLSPAVQKKVSTDAMGRTVYTDSDGTRYYLQDGQWIDEYSLATKNTAANIGNYGTIDMATGKPYVPGAAGAKAATATDPYAAEAARLAAGGRVNITSDLYKEWTQSSGGQSYTTWVNAKLAPGQSGLGSETAIDTSIAASASVSDAAKAAAAKGQIINKDMPKAYTDEGLPNPEYQAYLDAAYGGQGGSSGGASEESKESKTPLMSGGGTLSGGHGYAASDFEKLYYDQQLKMYVGQFSALSGQSGTIALSESEYQRLGGTLKENIDTTKDSEKATDQATKAIDDITTSTDDLKASVADAGDAADQTKASVDAVADSVNVAGATADKASPFIDVYAQSMIASGDAATEAAKKIAAASATMSNLSGAVVSQPGFAQYNVPFMPAADAPSYGTPNFMSIGASAGAAGAAGGLAWSNCFADYVPFSLAKKGALSRPANFNDVIVEPFRKALEALQMLTEDEVTATIDYLTTGKGAIPEAILKLYGTWAGATGKNVTNYLDSLVNPFSNIAETSGWDTAPNILQVASDVQNLLTNKSKSGKTGSGGIGEAGSGSGSLCPFALAADAAGNYTLCDPSMTLLLPGMDINAPVGSGGRSSGGTSSGTGVSGAGVSSGSSSAICPFNVAADASGNPVLCDPSISLLVPGQDINAPVGSGGKVTTGGGSSGSSSARTTTAISSTPSLPSSPGSSPAMTSAAPTISFANPSAPASSGSAFVDPLQFAVFAEGGPVTKTQLALVHEGEYVLPKRVMEALSNGMKKISDRVSGMRFPSLQGAFGGQGSGPSSTTDSHDIIIQRLLLDKSNPWPKAYQDMTKTQKEVRDQERRRAIGS